MRGARGVARRAGQGAEQPLQLAPPCPHACLASMGSQPTHARLGPASPPQPACQPADPPRRRWLGLGRWRLRWAATLQVRCGCRPPSVACPASGLAMAWSAPRGRHPSRHPLTQVGALPGAAPAWPQHSRPCAQRCSAHLLNEAYRALRRLPAVGWFARDAALLAGVGRVLLGSGSGSPGAGPQQSGSASWELLVPEVSASASFAALALNLPLALTFAASMLAWHCRLCMAPLLR